MISQRFMKRSCSCWPEGRDCTWLCLDHAAGSSLSNVQLSATLVHMRLAGCKAAAQLHCLHPDPTRLDDRCRLTLLRG